MFNVELRVHAVTLLTGRSQAEAESEGDREGEGERERERANGEREEGRVPKESARAHERKLEGK